MRKQILAKTNENQSPVFYTLESELKAWKEKFPYLTFLQTELFSFDLTGFAIYGSPRAITQLFKEAGYDDFNDIDWLD